MCGSAPAQEEGRYTYRDQHHPDGIGKFYMGREISHVMGHRGAAWLERDNRQDEERTDLVVELLELKSGENVADIGAGSGYYTRRMARKVAPEGKVFAVDIQPEMLEILTNKLAQTGITNVLPVLGEIENPNLEEESLDVAFMADVYHEFSHPYEMMAAISKALKPGGRVVFVEYRKEDPEVPIKELHKMSEQQVRREMEPHPLKWEKTVSDRLPWQHLIVFRKE